MRWPMRGVLAPVVACVVAIALLAATVTAALVSAGPASAQERGWLHTDGSSIVTADGEPYTIKSVSWFGMETDTCAPHGLWSISLDDGLAEIAAMGFGTIRIPYANECLAGATVSSINEQLNPDLVGLTALELLDRVIERAAAHGLTVILDRHRPGTDAQSALWYTAEYPEERWIADWVMLATRYADDPTVIGMDLHNEPRGDACWGCGDPALDWQAAATRAGNAILAVNPRVLIIVEGVERSADGEYTWWGGGLWGVATAPVVLDVPNRVVYSPHDYPSTVYAQSWFSDPSYPANLPALWERNWGYIQTENIAPVLLGEFGTRLETESDARWLETLVAYLVERRMGFSYWSFNPNSGDTGGMVEDDWVTPVQRKLDALAPLLVIENPEPTGVSTATPTPTPLATLAPSPQPTEVWSPDRGGPPVATAAPTAAPTATPSASGTPTSAPTASAAPSAPADAVGATEGLSVDWRVQSAWADGYVAEATLTAAETVTGWRLRWPSAGASGIVNSWGMTCDLEGEEIVCVGADWAARIEAGGQVRVGVQVAATAAPSDPEIDVEHD